MKSICFVNGSLRGKKASSLEFLRDVESRLPDAEYARKTISVMARVYAIVNCGFPRPVIFGECVRVLRNFCRRLSLNWRFAVCISGGPVVVMTKRVPLLDLKLKRAFAAIVSDLQSGGSAPKDDYLIRPVIPEPILLAWKRRVEKQMGMTQGGAMQDDHRACPCRKR